MPVSRLRAILGWLYALENAATSAVRILSFRNSRGTYSQSVEFELVLRRQKEVVQVTIATLHFGNV